MFSRRLWVALLSGLMCLSASTVYAQTIWGNDQPIIVALDGMYPPALLNNPYGYDYRPSGYLGPALKTAWPDLPAINLKTVYWGGELSNAQLLQMYVSLAKDTIRIAAQKNPSKKIVVISHSWGTVVAYQALAALQNTLTPRRISTWLTLGSPLNGNSIIKGFLNAYSAVFGSVYGAEYVLADRPLPKPQTVAHWNNI